MMGNIQLLIWFIIIVVFNKKKRERKRGTSQHTDAFINSCILRIHICLPLVRRRHARSDEYVGG